MSIEISLVLKSRIAHVACEILNVKVNVLLMFRQGMLVVRGISAHFADIALHILVHSIEMPLKVCALGR